MEPTVNTPTVGKWLHDCVLDFEGKYPGAKYRLMIFLPSLLKLEVPLDIRSGACKISYEATMLTEDIKAIFYITEETIGYYYRRCPHQYINVGFNSTRMVCMHCNGEQN